MLYPFVGLFFVMPCTDVYKKIDIRTVSFSVPPQEVRYNNMQHIHWLFLCMKAKLTFNCSKLVLHFANSISPAALISHIYHYNILAYLATIIRHIASNLFGFSVSTS